MATTKHSFRLLKGIYSINCSQLYRVAPKGWRSMSSGNAETNAKEAEKPDNAQPTQDLDTSKEEWAKLEAKLKEDNQNLTKKFEDINDKYKRSLAETENVRRRMQKQIDDAKLFGIQGFCKDLLEVADILNKATESINDDQLKGNADLKNLYEGLCMTETQVIKVFTKNGLVKIDPKEGEKFDPNFHEALFQQSVPGKEADTIAVVTKVGYQLHQRTLRPALVGVFK